MIGTKVGQYVIEQPLSPTVMGPRWLARHAENQSQAAVSVLGLPAGRKEAVFSAYQANTSKYLQFRSLAADQLLAVRFKSNDLFLVHSFRNGVPIANATFQGSLQRSSIRFRESIDRLLPVGAALDQLQASGLRHGLVSPWTIHVDDQQSSHLIGIAPLAEVAELPRMLCEQHPELKPFYASSSTSDLAAFARVIQFLIEPALTDRYRAENSPEFMRVPWLDHQANACLQDAMNRQPRVAGCATLLNQLQQCQTYLDGFSSSIQTIEEPLVIEEKSYSVFVELFAPDNPIEPTTAALAPDQGLSNDPSLNMPEVTPERMQLAVPPPLNMPATALAATSTGVSQERSLESPPPPPLPPPLPLAPPSSPGMPRKVSRPNDAVTGEATATARNQSATKGSKTSNANDKPGDNQDSRGSSWLLPIGTVIFSAVLFIGIVWRDRIFNLMNSPPAIVPAKPVDQVASDTNKAQPEARPPDATPESMLARMNSFRKQALDVNAEQIAPEEWKRAEELYLVANKSDHGMSWADFTKLCNDVSNAYKRAADIASGIVKYDSAVQDFNYFKGYHLSGAPQRVPTASNDEIDQLVKNAEMDSLKKDYLASAAKYTKARDLLIVVDRRARFEEATFLSSSGLPGKAVRLLALTAGTAVSDDSVNSLFDKLLQEDPELWLECAYAELDILNRTSPDIYKSNLDIARSYLARAYMRLNKTPELKQLITDSFALIPRPENFAGNPTGFRIRATKYFQFMTESIQFLGNNNLATQLFQQLDEKHELFPSYRVLAALALGRAQEFKKGMDTITSSDNLAADMNLVFSQLALQSNNRLGLDKSLAWKSHLTDLQKLESDYVLAVQDQVPQFLPADTLNKLDNVRDEYNWALIRRLGTTTRDKRYINFLEDLAKDLESERNPNAYLQALCDLTGRTQVLASDSTLEKLREACQARAAIMDNYLSMDDVSELIAVHASKNKMMPHEINSYFAPINFWEYVSVAAAMATAPLAAKDKTQATVNAASRLPDLHGQTTSGQAFTKREQNAKEISLVFKKRADNAYDVWLHEKSKDVWQLAAGTSELTVIEIKPTMHGTFDEPIIEHPVQLLVSGKNLLGFAINPEKPEVRALEFSPPERIAKEEVSAFSNALQQTVYLQLLKANDKVSSARWPTSPVILFDSTYTGKLPSLEVIATKKPIPQTSDNAKYFVATQNAAANFAQLVQYLPVVIPNTVKVDATKKPTLGIYFAPAATHKSYALQHGFEPDGMAKNSYSVFGKHKINEKNGLRFVLVCVDPTNMSSEQLDWTLQRCFLRALGLGLTIQPIVQVDSSLLDASQGTPSSGPTNLDRRMLRGLYSLTADANNNLIRESFKATMALPLPPTPTAPTNEK